MTFTLTLLRTDVLADLRDAGTNWSNAQIDRAIGQALGVYNLANPRQVTHALTGISLRTITLSAAAPGGLGATDYAALVNVESVEYPIAEWPPRYVRFSVFGAVLTMDVDAVPVAAAVNVQALLTHSLGATGTIEDADRELMAVGAARYALLQYIGDASESVNLQPGLGGQIRAMAEDRSRMWESGLDRYRRRVRQGRLFAVGEAYWNRDSVRFPD